MTETDNKTTNEHTPMKERILLKIQAHEVSVVPRFYFTLKLSLVAFLAFSILLVSIFIFNFILFHLRINNQPELLAFGPHGLWAFLFFFPWGFLAIDIGLIILLDWLLRRFRFVYRTPMLYILLGLVVISSVSGFVLDRGTPFNDRLYVQARAGALPIMILGDAYAHIHRPPKDGICACTIVAIDGSTLTMEDTRPEAATTTLIVHLPENDGYATTSGLSVGDHVIVAGELKNGVVEAYGVRKLPPGGPAKQFFFIMRQD